MVLHRTQRRVGGGKYRKMASQLYSLEDDIRPSLFKQPDDEKEELLSMSSYLQKTRHSEHLDMPLLHQVATDGPSSKRTSLLIYQTNISNNSTDFDVQCLIDSGASKDFVSYAIAKRARATFRPLNKSLQVGLANDNTIACKYTVKLPIRIGTYYEVREFYVLNMPALQMVLGKPWLTDRNPDINWKINSASFTYKNRVHELYEGGYHSDREKLSKDPINAHTLNAMMGNNEIDKLLVVRHKVMGEGEDGTPEIPETPEGCASFTTYHDGNKIHVLLEPVDMGSVEHSVQSKEETLSLSQI